MAQIEIERKEFIALNQERTAKDRPLIDEIGERIAGLMPRTLADLAEIVAIAADRLRKLGGPRA